MDKHKLTFDNGFAIRVLSTGRRFGGLGRISYADVSLRSDQAPWSLYFESDAGWRFDCFDLQEVQSDGKDATITLTATGRYNPRIQDGDAMGDSRFVAPRLEAPVATVRWRFKTICESIHEREWQGLTMAIEVDSPGAPVNWLLEHATWEIGGAAEGCVLIQQDVSTIDPEQVVQADSAFSTIEAFYTKEAGAWGGSYPMDMLPRAAGASICDFQVKSGLALCLFAEKPGLTRARLEKFADEDVIHYLDRPFFPLTEQARPPARTLLVCAQDTPYERHAWRNLWLDVYTHVRGRILSHYEFEPVVPHPGICAHLWDKELKERNETWTKELINAFPHLAALGFKDIFTFGVWESVTSDPERRDEDGNICGPYAFRFAERFGGAAGMRELCNAAREEGLLIYQWYGFQFSQYSPIWKEHPEWLLREQHGDPWDARYGGLWCGRMRTDFGDFLQEQILRVAEETGITGMFIDSYQNLGVTCVDWQAPDKAPQAERIWRMQSELQKRGFHFRCEIVTPFGVSQVGIYGFAEDKFRRRLWDDTVESDAYFVHFDAPPGFHTKGDAYTVERIDPAAYFRLAAHRAIPLMGTNPWHGKPLPGGDMAAAYGRVNRLYNEALPRMHRLRLVPGGTHVIWLDDMNQPSVIWAFEDVRINLEAAILDLETNSSPDRGNGGAALKAGSVYLVECDVSAKIGSAVAAANTCE